MRRTAVLIVTAFFMAGCGNAGPREGKVLSDQEEGRRSGFFWQLTKPRIQLNPIEEEEMPSVFFPGKEK
ncbi:MAG: hypothetical protein ABIA77_00320 [Candidatus Omnitrophota bacterium]